MNLVFERHKADKPTSFMSRNGREFHRQRLWVSGLADAPYPIPIVVLVDPGQSIAEGKHEVNLVDFLRVRNDSLEISNFALSDKLTGTVR